MATDKNKQKKQFRELSDEDLKNVTGGGGYIQYVDYNKSFGGDGGSDNSGTPIPPILPNPETGTCPSGMVASTNPIGVTVCVPA